MIKAQKQNGAPIAGTSEEPYQDVSSLFLVEGDKMFKTKKRFEEQKEAAQSGVIKRLTKQEEQERYLIQ